ncbi:MAG: hypothetical protein J6D09_03835 [Clostridia bacterium]|nr:hypothetical protein [Clostridia bacterium]
MEVSFANLTDEIKEIKRAIEIAKADTLEFCNKCGIYNEQLQRISKIDWHIQGLFYHFGNMIEHYGAIVDTAGNKVESANNQENIDISILMTGNDKLPHLYFELYAFINLFRISLDYFHRTLYKQFDNPKNLPKSFSAFKSQTTDCPLLERMANDNLILYFKDFRDCLNHYRTFSANRIYFLIQENIPIDEMPDLSSFEEAFPDIVKPMFRKNAEGKYVVNFYLPDYIFQQGETKKLVVKFTYNEKRNILATTMHAIRHLVFNYLELLTCLKSNEVKYHYNKNGFEKAVDYIDFFD